MKYSGIGGQAVMEGVMMKNGDTYAVAVRMPNGDITVKREKFHGLGSKGKFFGLPFFRGIFNFIDSLVLGMSALNYSSSFYEEDEDDKKSGKEKTPEQKKKEETAFSVITMLISVVFAIGIFVVGPWLLTEYVIRRALEMTTLSAGTIDTLIILFEGILRLLIFIGYVALISLMKDIKRVYMYHGAEHKCINCIEHGLELNVENVRKSSKEHKRCGTSFMLIVMCISILVMMFIRFDARWLRILSRFVLIPVIAGISYEILRLAGRHDNAFMNFISKPGLALQGITTREPDDEMIEVGIASVEAVFDWKQYQAENFHEGSPIGDVPKSCCEDETP